MSCDISHAHHCFLPALLGERIDYLKGVHRSLARERDPSIEPELGYSCGDAELHWAVPDADEIGPESTLLSELARIHVAFSAGDPAKRAAIMTQLAAFQVSSPCLKQNA